MKQHIAIILLVLLVISCAPKTEVEQAKPAETPAAPVKEEPEMPSPPIEEQEMPEQNAVPIEENIIEIKEDSFDPVEERVKLNTKIKWVNKDVKEHKIACYLKGTRVTTSSNLANEDSFEYTFTGFGEYICLDAIYGLRGTINVVMQKDLSTVTGGAVTNLGNGTKGTTVTGVVTALIVMFLFWKYGKRKGISKSPGIKKKL